MENVTSPAALEEEIDLLGLGRTLWRWKWFISGLTVGCTLIALLIALFKLPVLYRSDTVLQPARSPGNVNGLQTALSNFIALPGGAEGSNAIINYLESRTFKSWMIETFNLAPRLRPYELNDLYSVRENKAKGLITIAFLDRDPAFAAKVVAGLIEKLEWYLDHEYITEAKRNRIFVQQQVDRIKKEVEFWERQVPNTTISATEVLREQQAALVVYTELRKQYELARVEEAREIIAFKVLDPPQVPKSPTLPHTRRICALTFIISLFISIFLVFCIKYIQDAGKKVILKSKPSI